MKIEKKTKNWGSKETFNLVKGKSIADYAGKNMTISAVAIGEDVSNEDGTIVKTGYIYNTDGECYTTVSKTCRQQLDALIDMLDDDGNSIEVQVCSQQCKGNQQRQFVYLDMI